MWAEYCPDNTCEVIRTRTKGMSRARFEALAWSYLVHFSTYVYLDDWRASDDVQRLTDISLRRNATSGCATSVGSGLARCELESALASSALEVIFVRFDEGISHRDRLTTLPSTR